MTNKNFEYSGNFELEQTENSLQSYNEFIVNNICSAIKNRKSSSEILDFGAGIGTLSVILNTKIDANISCFEIDEEQASICASRGFQAYTNFERLEGKTFDLIFSSNVLEHIENDFEIVTVLKKYLKTNGLLFLYVPALNFLWTDMDIKVGHHRRYSKKRLKQIIVDNQLQINSIKYVDCLGVLAMLVVKVLGFNSDSGLGNSKSLKIYDKFVWPISKFMDIFLKRLIGKNLLLVAQNID